MANILRKIIENDKGELRRLEKVKALPKNSSQKTLDYQHSILVIWKLQNQKAVWRQS